MSVRNSNNLSARLAEAFSAHRRDFSIDSLEHQNDKTFKLSDITDQYGSLIADHPNAKYLTKSVSDFGSDDYSQSPSEIYVGRPTQFLNSSNSDFPADAYSPCSPMIIDDSGKSDTSQKETIVAVPRAIGTPDPHCATF
jgi:hypothetical protein